MPTLYHFASHTPSDCVALPTATGARAPVIQFNVRLVNMSRSPGCQASPLIDAIFYRLPYFTSGLTTNVSIENILDDFVVRNLNVFYSNLSL